MNIYAKNACNFFVEEYNIHCQQNTKMMKSKAGFSLYQRYGGFENGKVQ